MTPRLVSSVLALFALGALACTTTDRSPCGAGQTECGGACAWLTRDPANCGACGHACGQGHTCRAGICVCSGDQIECDGLCTDVRRDAEHCGSCSVACSVGQSCEAGQCVCDSGLSACGDRCVDAESDPEHCGACRSACAQDKFCSRGKCSSDCERGLTACGHACVDLDASAEHCGACGSACAAGRQCQEGVCACGAGLEACGTDCVDTSTNSGHCGACHEMCSGGRECRDGDCVCPEGQVSCEGECIVGSVCSNESCEAACTGGQVCTDGACQCPSDQELCGLVCVLNETCTLPCSASSGMLFDFENVSLTLPGLTADRWTGSWYRLTDTLDSNQTLAVERIGYEPCHRFALHTTGSDLSQPVGIGFNFKGTPSAPEPYDSERWVGVRFGARLGDETTKTVRLNIVTPWTRHTAECGATAGEVSDCGNHLGRFLRDENALTTDWQQFAFCFDRDLYPLEVPSNLTNEQRGQVARNLLQVEFQFNRDKQIPSSPSPGASYPEESADAPFDFWVDDVELVDDEDACPEVEFQSTTGTARPFPTNAQLGSCEPATDAAKFNANIARSYTRWRERYVVSATQGCRMDAAEPGLSNSQAVGYALLVAAVMGDKTLFDCLWLYAQDQGAAASLMLAEPDGLGSDTEADQDIAHALLLAGKQWQGDYESRVTSLLANLLTSDVANDSILPGSEWAGLDVFEPAQFVPSLYRVFARVTEDDAWTRLLANGYQTLRANALAFGTTKLVTDLCDSTGTPKLESDYGLDVTGGFTEPVYGYYAARVPWRLSWDACLESSSDGTELLAGILDFFVSVYDGGASIEHMLAGWDRLGDPTQAALADQMSFIGPIGAGAMAFEQGGDLRDRVFRAVLDLIESPEFNRSYYQTTIGLITLLQLSGNLPHAE